MNCQEFAQFLMEYLDGDLPPEQVAAFEEHLKLCPPCIHYLDSYKQCVELGKKCVKCEDDAIPEGVPEDLVKAILAARPPGDE